jgi:hypothetical protein
MREDSLLPTPTSNEPSVAIQVVNGTRAGSKRTPLRDPVFAPRAVVARYRERQRLMQRCRGLLASLIQCSRGRFAMGSSFICPRGEERFAECLGASGIQPTLKEAPEQPRCSAVSGFNLDNRRSPSMRLCSFGGQTNHDGFIASPRFDLSGGRLPRLDRLHNSCDVRSSASKAVR